MKDWDKWTKKELLKLPVRDWEVDSEYDSVLLVNTRMKHDSGYNMFAVIGCDGGTPKEIAGYMDDFRFGNFLKEDYAIIPSYHFAFDCSMHGVFRLHARTKICVGHCLSTTSFWFKKGE